MCEGLKNEVRLRLLARKMQFSGPTLRSLANFFIELLVVRFAVNFRRFSRVHGTSMLGKPFFGSRQLKVAEMSGRVPPLLPSPMSRQSLYFLARSATDLKIDLSYRTRCEFSFLCSHAHIPFFSLSVSVSVALAAAKQRKRTRGKSLGKPQRIAVPSSPSPAGALAPSVAATESARLGATSASSSSSSSRANVGPAADQAPVSASSSCDSSSSRNAVAQSDKGAREFATPMRSQRKRYFRKVARSPLADSHNLHPHPHAQSHAPTEAKHGSSASSNAFKVPTSSSSSSSSATTHRVPPSSSSNSSSAMTHALPISTTTSPSARDQPRGSPLRSSKGGRDASSIDRDHASDSRVSSVAVAAAPPRSPESTFASRLTNKRASQWGPPQRVLLSELPPGACCTRHGGYTLLSRLCVSA